MINTKFACVQGKLQTNVFQKKLYISSADDMSLGIHIFSAVLMITLIPL